MNKKLNDPYDWIYKEYNEMKGFNKFRMWMYYKIDDFYVWLYIFICKILKR